MKKHIIFDNYNVTENYDLAIENLIENGYYSTAEEIPESEIWEEVANMEQIWFDDERTMMEEFFSGKTLLVCGSVGRWNGRFAAGKVIEYDDLWKCWSDCDYIGIYDEGGHFYIKASHHDGTNIYEVKVLTEKGAELYSDWDYGWSGSRWDQLGLSEREVHERLWKNAKYSHIPHYAREVFGCKTR